MLPFLGLDSVVEPQRGPERSRLVGQIAHARAGAALPVQAEEGPLVEDVVDEHRELPALAGKADAQVGEVVCRELRVEPERGVGQRPVQRSADRVGPEKIQVDSAEGTIRLARRTKAPAMIVDQREARAHVLVAAGNEDPRPRRNLPTVCDRGTRLDLWHAGQAVTVRDASYDIPRLVLES